MKKTMLHPIISFLLLHRAYVQSLALPLRSQWAVATCPWPARKTWVGIQAPLSAEAENKPLQEHNADNVWGQPLKSRTCFWAWCWLGSDSSRFFAGVWWLGVEQVELWEAIWPGVGSSLTQNSACPRSYSNWDLGPKDQKSFRLGETSPWEVL